MVAPRRDEAQKKTATTGGGGQNPNHGWEGATEMVKWPHREPLNGPKVCCAHFELQNHCEPQNSPPFELPSNRKMGLTLNRNIYPYISSPF